MTMQTATDLPMERYSENRPDHVDRVLFVGSSRFFSDPFLRVLANELDGVDLRRIAGDALDGEVLGDGHGRPVLAVLGEEAAREMGIARIAGMARRLSAPLALACRDCGFGREVLGAGLFPHLVRGMLPLQGEIELIFAGLRVMLMGGSFLPPDARLPEQLAMGAPNGHFRPEVAGPAEGGAHLGRLTRREREVLGLLAQGFQNKRIAASLDLSEHTVKLHVHHIISKLGVSNRTEAALRFRRPLI